MVNDVEHSFMCLLAICRHVHFRSWQLWPDCPLDSTACQRGHLAHPLLIPPALGGFPKPEAGEERTLSPESLQACRGRGEGHGQEGSTMLTGSCSLHVPCSPECRLRTQCCVNGGSCGQAAWPGLAVPALRLSSSLSPQLPHLHGPGFGHIIPARAQGPGSHWGVPGKTSCDHRVPVCPLLCFPRWPVGSEMLTTEEYSHSENL